VGILLSAVGIAISFTLTEFTEYSNYLKVSAFFMPFCSAVSNSYQIIFLIENRRLLMFGMIVARPVLQIFIEVFAYSFFTKTSTVTDNMPTTIATVLSYVIVAVWIMWFNCGKTALGVTNLEEFPQIDFWNWDWKKLVYGLKLIPAAINALPQIFFQYNVMTAAANVDKYYSFEATKLTMYYKIFVFAVFGQIFRAVANASNSLYTQMCVANKLAANFSRISVTVIMAIIVSAIVDILLYLLLAMSTIL